VATGAWDVNQLLVVGALTRYRSEGRAIHPSVLSHAIILWPELGQGLKEFSKNSPFL
jgi:hypothetical protein